MKKRDKFHPYIRRMRPTDRADDLRTAMRLAFYSGRTTAFVLVQRGFPHSVLAVGKSRRDIQQSILVVMMGRKKFKQWARDVKHKAQPGGGETL